MSDSETPVQDEAIAIDPPVPTEVPPHPEAESERPRKKGLPGWVVALTLIIVLGGVYYLYTQFSKEPPPHMIHGKGD